MDEKFMRMAIEEARRAYEEDEVPVGAVIVLRGEIITLAHNTCEADSDPTAHAEVLAIRDAAKKLNGNLIGSTLYVTLEPCAMCMGAAILSRVSRIVFGAFDDRAGCCGSLTDLSDGDFGHAISVAGGIYRDECSSLLSSFFAGKRR